MISDTKIIEIFCKLDDFSKEREFDIRNTIKRYKKSRIFRKLKC